MYVINNIGPSLDLKALNAIFLNGIERVFHQKLCTFLLAKGGDQNLVQRTDEWCPNRGIS
jgi:hypothetical protein